MQELARIIGVVREENGKKLVEAGGKKIFLLGADELQADCTYRIVGTLGESGLHVELSRKLDGFDLRVYEKALAAVEKPAALKP